MLPKLALAFLCIVVAVLIMALPTMAVLSMARGHDGASVVLILMFALVFVLLWRGGR